MGPSMEKKTSDLDGILQQPAYGRASGTVMKYLKCNNYSLTWRGKIHSEENIGLS